MSEMRKVAQWKCTGCGFIQNLAGPCARCTMTRLQATVRELEERLHKADGMANEINILTREVRGAEGRVAELLRLATPWPLWSILDKLIEGTDFLLRDYDYRGLGWESIDHALSAARELRATLPDTPPVPRCTCKPYRSRRTAADGTTYVSDGCAEHDAAGAQA